MMYVLGMSHAINVLKAASLAPLSFSHDNWSAMNSAGQFFDIQTKPGLIDGNLIKAFIASKASGWGSVAELRTLPDGQRQVVAVDGFISLLLSLQVQQDDATLFSFVHGNEHSMLSLVQHEVPYDFLLPGHEDIGWIAGAQPIAYELIRRQLEKALNPTIGCLAMMRMQLPRIRLVHVLPPAPIASDARIMQAPEVFREQLAHCGISALSLRLKYYLLAVKVLREALQPFDVILLENPLQAIAADGSLKDEYAFGATHADESYGALVLEQMQTVVKG